LMPLFSLCCSREVGTKEPKICPGCNQRVYKTTTKPPPGYIPKQSPLEKQDHDATLARLTDERLYTGMYKKEVGPPSPLKERDPSGRWKLEAQPNATPSGSMWGDHTYHATSSLKPLQPLEGTPQISPRKSSPQRNQRQLPALNASPRAQPTGSGDIFSRLTDASQYTGSHKNRFNSDGTGRGKEGRSDASAPGLNSMRTNLSSGTTLR